MPLVKSIFSAGLRRRQSVLMGWLACVLLSGCAHIKPHVKEFLDDVGGLDPEEQREIVATTRKVALAPLRHGGMGLYVSGAAKAEQGAGGEIGLAGNEYLFSYKAGLAAHASSAANDIFVGPTAALHLQLPTRLTPFAGVGVFAGYSKSETRADGDGFDNDDDGFVDELGEEDTEFDGFFASVFPEIGVHFWPTKHVRLTASASYHITTEGRSHDFWMLGGGIAIMSAKPCQ